MRKLVFRLRFAKPRTIVVIATLKLYIGQQRIESETAKVISNDIELIIMKIGLPSFLLNTEKEK